MADIEKAAILNEKSPTANMYGCEPCPKCGDKFRWPKQDGQIQCDKCGFNQPFQRPT